MPSHINNQKWNAVKSICVVALVIGSHSISFANERKEPIQPFLLKKGDKVAIVAPSFWLIDAKSIVSEVTKLLHSWG